MLGTLWLGLKIVFRDIFTGIDGKTYHMAKFSWASSFALYTGIVFFKLHNKDPAAITDIATGYTIICAGHSAAIYGMAKQEPGATPPTGG